MIKPAPISKNNYTGSLPDKPKCGEPCNRCGICCAMSLCPAGEILFPDGELPCPALVFNGEITACTLVLMEQKTNLEPILSKLLAIGLGCTMEDLQ